MSERHDETRARIAVDGEEFEISPNRDLVSLMEQIETAAQSHAAFVHIRGGDESVSVLVTPHSKIVLRVDFLGSAIEEDEQPFSAVPADEQPADLTADWEYW